MSLVRSTVRGIAVGACCLSLGVTTGLSTMILHSHWWGLVLGLMTTAALLRAIPSRWFRAWCVVGWGSVLVTFVPARPEGDFLVSGNAQGLGLIGGGVAVLLIGLVSGAPPRGPRLPGVSRPERRPDNVR
jgi:hypothetical protein